jgi:hypothetical protein
MKARRIAGPFFDVIPGLAQREPGTYPLHPAVGSGFRFAAPE